MLKHSVCATALALAACAANAAPCTVLYNAPPHVTRVLDANGDFTFRDLDAICTKLEKANARLYIGGDATVRGKSAIAWALIRLGDKHLRVMSNKQDYATLQSNKPTQAAADGLLWQAINNAVDEMDVDAQIASLNASRAAVKAGAKQTPP